MFFSSGRKLYHSPFPQVDTIGEKWFTDKGSNDTGSNDKGSNDTRSNDKGSKARQRAKKCDKGAIYFKILTSVTVSYLLLFRDRLG